MSKLSQPAVRRAAYFVVAAVLAVLVAVGLVSEEQYASWTELAERFLPLLGTNALPVAGAAATITGGTAVYNVPKATDQKQDLSIAEIGGALLSVIREGQALAVSKPETAEPETVTYEGKHHAPNPFSVYR